ncbi:copper resistance CopC family protein [Pontivivens insulae]|uniref:Copper resistance protein C n=1 Tax=Pontivivens insulae TaxID=1639689 RepID=A0A2R8AG02_9RHOB|nr:copper resistance CopC family protein [Pontivivens insulae]RED10629.1 hypothetical protein DFR53_3444 [Pontivivens insulae]SPF31161.1 Copper resistance protein C [Pontivivens insulae]
MKRLQVVLAVALTLGGVNGAFAHSDTETTTPANGATVAAVEEIELRFDDPMRVTQLILTGPDGEIELERETGLEPVTVMRAVPIIDLASGDFLVEWRGLSSDGHPMQGGFEFSVAD